MNKNSSLPFDKSIYVDHIFSDPKTAYLVVRSSIYDNDAGVDDDPMSVGKTRPLSLERLANGKEHNLPGDRDSENVEVYYTVTEVGDLY